VVIIFYLLPPGFLRQVFLVAVSYAYYLTFPARFFLVLLLLTMMGYFGALLIERSSERPGARWIGPALIAASFIPLAFYKYLVPLVATSAAGPGAHWQLTIAHVVLPIGLSFYTFAVVGYLIDVHLGIMAAERNLLRVALFAGFFPYVTSGPIPRAPGILSQLKLDRQFAADRGLQGLREIAVGVVMKFWIADSLSAPSAAVYGDLANTIPLEKFVATIFFAFQMYADFAGYSLIAIGSARLLGVDLPDNFRQPFLSASLAEFWRRWHISLFTWLRDYVFTPVNFHLREYPKLASPIAIFLTLTLVGIWHGMGWGFLVFGMVHGLFLAISTLSRGARETLYAKLGTKLDALDPARVLATFLIVALTLVLIRAQTLSEAISIYRSIFSMKFLGNLSNYMLRFEPDPALGLFRHIHAKENLTDIALIAALIAGDWVARSSVLVNRFATPILAVLSTVCVLTILNQIMFADAPKLFVYFQF
jgi:D-alanyl-lipoteichoic acid acyltransferase DltB (MBOAT superfamily)